MRETRLADQRLTASAGATGVQMHECARIDSTLLCPRLNSGDLKLENLRTTMSTVQIDIPAELLRAAGVSEDKPSEQVTKLLALELYREGAVSLGRAAELCRISVAHFMEFASEREVDLDFDPDELEHDRCTLGTLGL